MKEYYKYYEIIMGLRNEYIKNHALLKELEKQILIESDNVENYKVIPLLQSERDRNETSKLMLHIYKKQSNILKKIRTIASSCDIIKNVDTSHYAFSRFDSEKIIEIKDSTYIFDLHFNPLVKVANQNAFDDICDEIYNSHFLTLPDLFIKINSFQSLSLDGDNISLSADFDLINRNEWLNVTYFSRTDSIKITADRNSCSRIGEMLLATEIPRYKIHPKYRDIIDKNIVSNSHINIVGCLNRGQVELVVNENKKPYVLTKKAYPKKLL